MAVPPSIRLRLRADPIGVSSQQPVAGQRVRVHIDVTDELGKAIDTRDLALLVVRLESNHPSLHTAVPQAIGLYFVDVSLDATGTWRFVASCTLPRKAQGEMSLNVTSTASLPTTPLSDVLLNTDDIVVFEEGALSSNQRVSEMRETETPPVSVPHVIAPEGDGKLPVETRYEPTEVARQQVTTPSDIVVKRVVRALLPNVGEMVDVSTDIEGRFLSGTRKSDGSFWVHGVRGPFRVQDTSDPLAFDLVIYGGTLSGIMAAKRAALRGWRVCVVEPSAHLGGVISGGLAETDKAIPASIDAIWGDTRQVFIDLNSAATGRDTFTPRYSYEPHVAETVFNRTLLDTGATVILNSPIYSARQLDVINGRVRAMSTTAGWVRGRYWIDASYEMDMARYAGAPYRVGRESKAEFGEPSAGLKTDRAFKDPGSYPGLTGTQLPFTPIPTGVIGSADQAIQPYSFRHALTNEVGNTLRFVRPAGYLTSDYAALKAIVLARGFTSWTQVIFTAKVYKGRGKHIINNGTLVSIELPGRNWDYPTASRERRAELVAAQVKWQQGFYYYLQSDLDCPPEIQASFQDWGLPLDEHQDSPFGNNWPPQLYIREACRLNGRALITELDVCGLSGGSPARATSIAFWRYFLDCHPVQVYLQNGLIFGEGPTRVPNAPVPYEIPAEALIPSSGPENLLVSVCISATHVAWMPTRMEPLFAMCGEAAGEIAAQCLAAGDVPVSHYNYARLATALTERGSKLRLPG
ncbi:FAD-dependent oxidoreductase [Roseomonas sp. WA12]